MSALKAKEVSSLSQVIHVFVTILMVIRLFDNAASAI